MKHFLKIHPAYCAVVYEIINATGNTHIAEALTVTYISVFIAGFAGLLIFISVDYLLIYKYFTGR